jgi:hypothetical protein
MQSPLQAWIVFGIVALGAAPIMAQRVQFPESSNGLRPIAQGGSTPGTAPTLGAPVMIPVNPATQAGIYPSTGFGSPSFDPYAAQSQTGQVLGGVSPANLNPYGSPYPAYNGAAPVLPGAGQSAIMGTFPNSGATYAPPSAFPNSAPSALFPGATYGNSVYDSTGGGLFGGFFNNLFGSSGYNNFGGSYGQLPAQPTFQQPNYGGSVLPPLNGWNPQGSVFTGNPGTPQYLRLFQGPRFRHAWIYGNSDANALMINDSDVSLAFVIPNFLYSTQPLYLLPSFSLHQWDGPHPSSTADLPALAYSAFLDSGWQADPARILGAELGLRVGMFSDFDTATSDSLRVMGRAIGRLRLTPRTTLKAGVMYLDRNKVKLLPAGGLLWQPNPDTRFDLFFPEPKLAHYLSTVGTMDTWWYVGGYYGGGAWTITRADKTRSDSIDINDLRLVLGLEWGRNEQMRDGRRFGFLEIGYVFDRELLYRASPSDNLSLQDTVMIRAGIGY